MEPASGAKIGWLELVRRRPALAAALPLIAGIFAYRLMPAEPRGLACGAMTLAIAAIIVRGREILCCGLIAVALALAGAAGAQAAAYFYASDDICQFTTDETRLAQLEVRIDDPPRLISASGAFNRPNQQRQVTRGAVVRVLTIHGWTRASGTILLSLNEPIDGLRINQMIRLTGMLHRPTPAMNPGQFDWARYYREDRILAAVSVPHRGAATILADPGPSPLAQLRARARELLAAGFTKEQSLDHALLRALVLGDTDPELRDVQEDFRRTGTSHHLAISGMHVAILGFIIYWICRLFLLRPRFAVVLGLLAVMLYGVVVLPSPPVVRSLLLCIAFAVGLLRGRFLDGVNLLAATVIAMLLYHPLDLYNAGFQLSFGTVLCLMLFTQHVQRRVLPPDIDEQVALSLTGHRAPRRLRLKHWLRRHASAIISTGVVAWLVSQPLVMHHFEQLNPWAIVGSILLAVFVLFALTAGFLKLLLTLLLPSLAPWWAQMADFFVSLMRWAVDELARLPLSDLPMSSPPPWMLVGLYLLMLLPFVTVAWPRVQRRARWGPGLAAGLILILPFTAGVGSRLNRNPQLSVTTLSVGAGLCCVVEMPNGDTALIDAGSSSINDLHRTCLAPFLRHEGRRSVECIFLSHRDYDHISAAIDAVRAYDVPRVFVAPQFRAFAQQSHPARNVLTSLEAQQRPPRQLRAGDIVPLSRQAQIEVLWPPENCAFDSNDTGLVLRLTCRGRSILFPADVQADAQRELLKHPEKLKADILVAPHHGSCEVTTGDFLRAVAPSAIVSSNDHTLTRKQRQFERIAAPYRLYRTDRDGAVTVTVNGDGAIEVRTFASQ